MVWDETYLMYKQSTPKIGAGLEKKGVSTHVSFVCLSVSVTQKAW